MHPNQEDELGTSLSASVAVVDDDPRIRRLLGEELEDEGYRVLLFSDGFGLLDTIDSDPPDLILLDLMMPQLDGIQCLRKTRDSGYSGPILIFTALNDNEKRREAEEHGANEYILKPDLFENLSQVIKRYL